MNRERIMNEETGQTWPEQEIIEAWVNRHGLKIDREVLYDLKKTVTTPRIKRDDEDRVREKDLPTIVEIIPDNFPDWAKAAFHCGQYFRVSMSRISELEEKVKKQIKTPLDNE